MSICPKCLGSGFSRRDINYITEICAICNGDREVSSLTFCIYYLEHPGAALPSPLPIGINVTMIQCPICIDVSSTLKLCKLCKLCKGNKLVSPMMFAAWERTNENKKLNKTNI